MISNEVVTVSSGNVFADLGFSNPVDRLAKAELAYKISEIIIDRGLKQEDAAKLMRIPQPKVSLILNGKLSGFSLEKLIQFLNYLNQEVQIVVKDRADCKEDMFSLTMPEISKMIKSLFNFPVPQPKHPILASKMPLWDYSEDYLPTHFNR